jgi:hypothetical protein
VTISREFRVDEISLTVERDHTRITHHHSQRADGGELGGTGVAADAAKQLKAYLLDQETEQKKYRAIDGGHVEPRHRQEMKCARGVNRFTHLSREHTADAKSHVRRDHGVLVGVGVGEDRPKGYGGGRTSVT